MKKRHKEIIDDNLKAYENNFEPIDIVEEDYGNGYYVYQRGDSSYIQFCENIHYLNGWLYGAVQAYHKRIKAKEKEE